MCAGPPCPSQPLRPARPRSPAQVPVPRPQPPALQVASLRVRSRLGSRPGGPPPPRHARPPGRGASCPPPPIVGLHPDAGARPCAGTPEPRTAPSARRAGPGMELGQQRRGSKSSLALVVPTFERGGKKGRQRPPSSLGHLCSGTARPLSAVSAATREGAKGYSPHRLSQLGVLGSPGKGSFTQSMRSGSLSRPRGPHLVLRTDGDVHKAPGQSFSFLALEVAVAWKGGRKKI